MAPDEPIKIDYSPGLRRLQQEMERVRREYLRPPPRKTPEPPPDPEA
jgi:hypothetical protein